MPVVSISSNACDAATVMRKCLTMQPIGNDILFRNMFSGCLCRLVHCTQWLETVLSLQH